MTTKLRIARDPKYCTPTLSWYADVAAVLQFLIKIVNHCRQLLNLHLYRLGHQDTYPSSSSQSVQKNCSFSYLKRPFLCWIQRTSMSFADKPSWINALGSLKIVPFNMWIVPSFKVMRKDKIYKATHLFLVSCLLSLSFVNKCLTTCVPVIISKLELLT